MEEDFVSQLAATRLERAKVIAAAGGIDEAIASGQLSERIDTTLSEALVLGLLQQDVRRYLVVLGHGSTEIGEVLRVYEEAGVIQTYAVRHETAASHAATALRWVTGEKAAVVTSIGPGAMHAFAGSLATASDGLGVYYLFGDETTEDEGPNMQQIPKHEQHLFLKLCSTMGNAYCLHTPLSLPTALRRGLNTIDHPYRGGPFFLLLPMNTQPASMKDFNLQELPVGTPPSLGPAQDDGRYQQAAKAVAKAKRVVVRIGGGGRDAGPQIDQFLELADGVAITSPLVSGVIPYEHPRNMTVAGSKGSICGNHAQDRADLLVAIGSRFVCQSDSSRTAYPNVEQVININADLEAATHYGNAMALVGDAAATLEKLNEALQQEQTVAPGTESDWFRECVAKKQEWDSFKAERYNQPTLQDSVWGGQVLTQPAAIKVAADWARSQGDVVNFFDAGDVQANGFQVVEDDRLGRTVTETGASYMGFAVSAVLASGLTDKPFFALAFSGDGSFTMNPQILIDGVEHGARGAILLFDNRRMGAITGLQHAQYEHEHATNDQVQVDYVAWTKSFAGIDVHGPVHSTEHLQEALEASYANGGLSVIYVPVYFGPDEMAGLGAFGRWNVGNWSEDTQRLRHQIGL
ncbi:MAG: thiamine pyrophosphate-dependent enzyme [Pirellulaceae bacterium]|nr:thiamine pyrophosphate-dependent enzyme [Pirellulaceae bacterium]